MPRTAKVVAKAATGFPSSTFVLDNGAYTIKAGWAPSGTQTNEETLSQCHSIPNALARTRDRHTYVGSQIDTRITQWSEVIFRRPVERGQLVNWEAEKEIWDQSFFDSQTARTDLLIKQPEDTTLILAEAPNTMPALQKNADEIIMEEWGFGAYSRVVGGCVQYCLTTK
jgi:actin-related protein 6